MMPRTNYTIDLTTKTILLTISIKNTGVDEWPSGFYLGLLRTNDFKLEQRENDDKLIKYNPEINKQVKPNSVVVLNVQLYPPSTVGIFTYYLSLHTLSKVPFGDEIEFTFTVKNGVSPITYCGQYSDTIAASSLIAASISISSILIISSFRTCYFSISSSWNSVKSFPGGLLGIPDDVILRISDVTNFKSKLKTAAPQAEAKYDAAIVFIMVLV